MSGMTQEEEHAVFAGFDEAMTEMYENLKPPTCHFTIMEHNEADDGDQSVEWFECKHCGCQKGLSGDYLGNANE